MCVEGVGRSVPKSEEKIKISLAKFRPWHTDDAAFLGFQCSFFGHP